MFNKDARNIQMLKCFTLENVLQGILLLLAKVNKNYFVSTVVLDTQGTTVAQFDDTFDFTRIGSKDKVLFLIDIKDRGRIVLDLFQMEQTLKGKVGQVGQISTLTERGSSLLNGQTGVAYFVANLPQEDMQYLSYEMVKTLFHEFGHAMNIALSQTKY